MIPLVWECLVFLFGLVLSLKMVYLVVFFVGFLLWLHVFLFLAQVVCLLRGPRTPDRIDGLVLRQSRRLDCRMVSGDL